MGWNASTQSEFVAEHLGPAMEEAGYGDVEIMIFDDQVSEQKGRNENCSRLFQKAGQQESTAETSAQTTAKAGTTATAGTTQAR